MTIAPHEKKDTGQRDVRSLVGRQLNCVLPARRWLFGNSGEGFTILPASRMRLSQKMSSALSPGSGAALGLAAAFLPSAGDSIGSRFAVPKSGLLESTGAATRPICSDTLVTSASSASSISRINGRSEERRV